MKGEDRPKPIRINRTEHLPVPGMLSYEDIQFQLVDLPPVWGTEVFDGRQVGHDHLVADGDLVELHV